MTQIIYLNNLPHLAMYNGVWFPINPPPKEEKLEMIEKDEIKTSLQDMTLPEAYVYVARVLGVPAKELLDKYNHLNPGMIRMNLGNRLRGFLARSK